MVGFAAHRVRRTGLLAFGKMAGVVIPSGQVPCRLLVLRLRQVFGMETRDAGDDGPIEAFSDHFASVVEGLLSQALLDAYFDSFLSPPIDDFRHVALPESLVQFPLLLRVQSTLDNPEGKQESHTISISGLKKG